MAKPEIICECEIHPAASLFPLVEGTRFQSLVDSIEVHGVQNPIVCSGNVVLDGRNRLRAVEKLRNEGKAVDLPAIQWSSPRGMTETQWITAQNLDRRHLSEDAYVTAQAALNRILRKEAKERQAATKFDTEKAKAARSTARTKRSEPSKRDTKAEDARSTAGQVAEKAGVSLRKAKQAVKLDQAVESGVIPEEVQKDVISGKTKLRDAVKQVPAKTKP
jgi:ParB-like chromosome segregation protein Spo0J